MPLVAALRQQFWAMTTDSSLTRTKRFFIISHSNSFIYICSQSCCDLWRPIHVGLALPYQWVGVFVHFCSRCSQALLSTDWPFLSFSSTLMSRSLAHLRKFLESKVELHLFFGRPHKLWTVKFLQVTKREEAPESEWSTWTWISEGDMMLNGAFFRSSGSPRPDVDTPSFAKSVSSVSSMTASAGVLSCMEGSQCWNVRSGRC